VTDLGCQIGSDTIPQEEKDIGKESVRDGNGGGEMIKKEEERDCCSDLEFDSVRELKELK
jgi:hypothetical protein